MFFQKDIIQKFQLLKREIDLLWQTPINYLYSYKYPTNKKVIIKSYDPNTRVVGQKIVRKINNIFPELKTHLIGSAVLGIAGQKDVDLFIECDPRKISKYLPKFKKIFGNPLKIKKNFAEWRLSRKNCSVEILLINPNSNMFQMPVKTFKLIQKDKKLIKEYEQIKKKSNGLSLREYQKRRLVFFNRILGLNSFSNSTKNNLDFLKRMIS